MTDSLRERLEELKKRKEPARQPGADAPSNASTPGKILARERIEYLLDAGSFHELDMLADRPMAWGSRTSVPSPTA